MQAFPRSAVAVLVLCACLSFVHTTPLDDYVHAPDPTYSWTINATIESLDFTAYMVHMISQTWLNSSCSNRAVWQHWLVICVPKVMKTTTGFIYIDGGDITDGVPSSIYPPVEMICLEEGAVGAHLQDIPNEPIVFANDHGKKRSEDALIAFTWSHFLNDTSDPYWLARMPMTKAAVKAMDTIQALTSQLNKSVDSFIVGGASKRGWTTWTTAAVDTRVVAIVPIVMPILNMVPNLNHHYQAYGGWSFALDDYLNMGIMGYLNTDVFQQMANIIDPYTYNSRLTMPKYMICATGDEFFLPDSPQFFLNELPGEKQLRMVPNAEHSLAGHALDLTSTIIAFYHIVVTKQSFPEITWAVEYQPDGGAIINVTSTLPPSEVNLYSATTISTTKRDFRLIICDDTSNPNCIQPVIWFAKGLQSTSDGVYTYTAQVSAPNSGWRGFFIEAAYAVSGTTNPFKTTTEVYIIPNTMPFPACGEHCQ